MMKISFKNYIYERILTKFLSLNTRPLVYLLILIAVFITTSAGATTYKIQRNNDLYDITYSKTAIDFATGAEVIIESSSETKTEAWIEAKIAELNATKQAKINSHNADIASIDGEIAAYESIVSEIIAMPEKESIEVIPEKESIEVIQ